MSSDNRENGRRRFEDRFAEKVVDPDDYNRTQRFKEIHQARQRVSEFVTKMDIPDDGTSYYLNQASRLAHLVSLYILELEPLLIQSDVNGGDLLPSGSSYGSLRDFAMKMGLQYGNSESSPPSPYQSIQIYSAANRFYAQAGMDLEMHADEGDAGFDYSDILEDGPPNEGVAPDIKEVEVDNE